MNVEVMVVVDPSAYENYKNFSNATNDETLFDNIRIFYAHKIKGVNEMFHNSLKNDPDLRINIKLVHVLIITVRIYFLFI